MIEFQLRTDPQIIRAVLPKDEADIFGSGKTFLEIGFFMSSSRG